jgi:hypothetical protein
MKDGEIVFEKTDEKPAKKAASSEVTA